MLFSLLFSVLQESSFTHTSDWEIFIMDSLYDFSLVTNFLAPTIECEKDINNTLFNIVNDNMQHVLVKIFKVNRNCITDTENKLKHHLVEMKLQESISQLQNVGAIPRLYRRTNRSPPKEASQYVIEAIKPVLEFQKKFTKLEPGQAKDILKQIILKMTEQ